MFYLSLVLQVLAWPVQCLELPKAAAVTFGFVFHLSEDSFLSPQIAAQLCKQHRCPKLAWLLLYRAAVCLCLSSDTDSSPVFSYLLCNWNEAENSHCWCNLSKGMCFFKCVTILWLQIRSVTVRMHHLSLNNKVGNSGMLIPSSKRLLLIN